jgi:uncharacterized membrane protein
MKEERKAKMMCGFGFSPSIFGLIFGSLFGLGALTLIVLLIIWAARSLRRSGGMGSGEDPLAILKARYAKSEISQAEYKRLLKELKE